MNKKNYDVDLEENMQEPKPRKRTRTPSFVDDDYFERKRKKSGKRFHRKPTHKDGFGEN